MSNKFLIIIVFIFFGQIAIGQVDTRTKNQVRAKFEMAKEYYADKEYTSTLKKLEEIEGLMNGAIIPTAQSLKVSALLKLKRYEVAKNELAILENLELSSTIIKEVASYRQIINDFDESERARKRKELETKRQQVIQKEEARKKKIIQEAKEEKEKIAFETAMNEFSVSSFKDFVKNYPKSKYVKQINYHLGKFNNTVTHVYVYYSSKDSTKYHYFENIKYFPNIKSADINFYNGYYTKEIYLTRSLEYLKNHTNIEKLEISYVLNDEQINKIYDIISLRELTINIKGGMTNTNLQGINKLSNLEYLRIKCGNNRLPESICDLSQLKELVHQGGLTLLPENTGNLSQLEKIKIGGNKLTSLPKSIGNLSQLKELDLGYNKLTSLPKSICNLSQLKTLNIQGNELTSLPDDIGNLSNLEKLALYENKLTSLPESIGNLSLPKELNLGKNKLTSLPESIGNLSQLEELNLYENKLTSLPEKIGDLSQLRVLILTNNDLTSLPESFVKLTNLKFLYIRNLELDKRSKQILKELKKKNRQLKIIK